VNSLSPTSD